MPVLSRITLYPIKSLDGVEVSQAGVIPGAGLKGDREWALVDGVSRPVTGKRTAAVHGVRTRFSSDLFEAEFDIGGRKRSFRLPEDAEKIGEWLFPNIGESVRLERAENGFPDHADCPGPSLLGRETLEEVGRWFPRLRRESLRRRFRANLGISGAVPFWEDRLVPPAGGRVRFKIGGVLLEGLKACARCVVPTRDPETGEGWAGFAAKFSALRAESLPAWAPKDRFDHYYRLAVLTRIVEGGPGAFLRVGDRVEILND